MTNLEKYNEAFTTVFSVSAKDLNDEFNAGNIDSWDSVHQLSIVAQLEEIFDVMFDPALESVDMKVRPKAPGMKYTHYAPKGKLTIVEGEREKVAAKIAELVACKQAEGYKTAVLCDTENMNLYSCENVLDAGSKKNEITVSSSLYRLLRLCDDIGADYIYSESFREGDMGYAIMNRLIKAAGHRIISV